MALSYSLLLVISVGMLVAIVIFNVSDVTVWLYQRGLQEMRSRLGRLLSKAGEAAVDPEVQEQVAQLLSARRVRFALLGMAMGRAMGTALAIILIGHILAGRSIFPDITLFLYGLGFGFVSVFPRVGPEWAVRRAMPLIHVYLATLLVARMVLAGSATTPTSSATNMLVTCAVSLIWLDIRLLGVTNAVLTAVSLFNHKHFDRMPDDGTVDPEVYLELVYLCLRLGLAYTMETHLRLSAQNEVMAQCGQCQQSAVSSLLETMCDAVVELDQAFRLNAHYPKLSNMLMHGIGRSLEGAVIFDFMSDGEDKEKFQESLGRHASDGTGGMLTSRLRDSMGNFVKVALFHVHFLSVGGMAHHLVGIREEVDAWAVANPSGMPEELAANTGARMPQAILLPFVADELGGFFDGGQLPPTFGPPRPHRGSGAGRLSGGSSRSSSSSWSSRSSTRIVANAAAPVCDFGGWEEPQPDMVTKIEVRGALPVVKMGQELRAKLGLESGEACDFGEFLPQGGTWFRCWIQESVDDAIELNYGKNWAEPFGEMPLVSQRPGAQGQVTHMAFVYFKWPPRSGGQTRSVTVGLSRGMRNPGSSIIVCPPGGTVARL